MRRVRDAGISIAFLAAAGIAACRGPVQASSAVPEPSSPAATKAVGTLSDEARALEVARQALQGRRIAEALEVLDGYERRFPRGALAPEALRLRSAALAATSRAPIPEETIVPVRTLRYREFFTGRAAERSKVQTWTLILGQSGRAKLIDERAEADANSLVAGQATALSAVIVQGIGIEVGSWAENAAGSIELTFGPSPSIHCERGVVLALEAGAELVPGRRGSRGPTAVWHPPTRARIEVLHCARVSVPGETTWADEPQPRDLPFADLPGVEYAHDDGTARKGALRRLGESE